MDGLISFPYALLLSYSADFGPTYRVAAGGHLPPGPTPSPRGVDRPVCLVLWAESAVAQGGAHADVTAGRRVETFRWQMSRQ